MTRTTSRQLTSFSGAAIGRMIPVDKIRPNPDQPRKALGDLRELTDSIREKGVLEPLLVRFVPREDTYYIISGERRYHASRAAGLREVPCIEKIADDAETLELALIENLQRKDLTPLKKPTASSAWPSSSPTRTTTSPARSPRRARRSPKRFPCAYIPDAIRRRCIEHGIVSKSLLLQIARQPNEKKMREMVDKIASGGLTRDEARRERQEEKAAGPRPQPFIFNFQPENEAFRLRIQFRKSNVSREELATTLRAILREIESESAKIAVA